MAYIPNGCSIEQYENQIYSGDSQHILYIKHGATILENASPFASRLTWKRRILKNGSNTFNLNNFQSQEIELVLHDYYIENLNEELEIKIGTYIEEIGEYVYVPLGIYKIQDNPTTDKAKTTYKLRDRSVNFDFNYNAKPLIEESENVDEEGNQYVTKLDILLDICSQANVEYVGVQNFIGYDDPIGIYDNTITGRKYVAYIFEQAGLIPTINREGQLIAIDINNLTTKQIDANLLESFEKGDNYEISKVVYESGEIKWEIGEDTKDKLFISSSNPYISKEEDINRLNGVIGFKINSFSTGKVLGNLLIDPYDLIEVIYEGETYTTLAQYTFTFSGTMISKYDTTIKYDAKQSNVSLNNNATFQKYVKTEIDNVKGTLTTTVKTTNKLEEEVDKNSSELEKTQGELLSLSTTITQNNQYVVTSINQLKENIENGVQTLRNTLVTIDIEGIKVATNESAISTLITNDSFIIRNYDQTLAQFNNDGAVLDNLTVRQYFIAGVHRQEKYTDEETGELRTGWFYVGGEE